MEMDTRRTTSHTYREHNFPSYNPPQHKMLTPQHMYEIKEKGLYFNCDNKYSEGNKCREKRLFYIDCEEEVEK